MWLMGVSCDLCMVCVVNVYDECVGYGVCVIMCLLCVSCVSLRGVICDIVLKQVNMGHSVLCVLCTYVNWSM